MFSKQIVAVVAALVMAVALSLFIGAPWLIGVIVKAELGEPITLAGFGGKTRCGADGGGRKGRSRCNATKVGELAVNALDSVGAIARYN